MRASNFGTAFVRRSKVYMVSKDRTREELDVAGEGRGPVGRKRAKKKDTKR